MIPSGAIMHYTAGFTAKSAISTLTNPRAKVSAHLVIDTDGSITQLVEFNRIAWHAGPSKLGGRVGCNNFTIGFEFVNPGYFRQKGGAIYDWEGKSRIPESTLRQYDLSIIAPNSRIGGGTFIWPGYNRAQIEAGLEAFAAICAAYKIEHLAGHEDIDTRGWKTDPGPAFPMGEFRKIMTGSNGSNDRSDGFPTTRNRMTVSASRLNVREKPSLLGKIITTLSGGSEVVVLEDTGKWSLVEYAPGMKGWLADTYLKKG